ncbi:MAG TPA: LacI family DNA-binding transcriptional regulator [Acidisarcina sp.]|nr:LacI family DNA-binding transcriptional regulator [Acidisarcina sp.]
MKAYGSPPTLSDVARKAGVGITTVSRVVNGGDQVSPQTLQRVKKVIQQMGFIPNQAARVLKGERTKIIGILIPSIADPFFSTCAEAAQQIARANDSLLIVAGTNNDPRLEMESIRLLLRHSADGLLLVPANDQNSELAAFLNSMSAAAVAFDRPVFSSRIGSVVTDNLEAAYRATQHLIQHGHQRILCLCGESQLYTLRERISGYRKAMEEARLPSLVDMNVKDYRSAEYAIESHLSSDFPPDAILTLKNSTTIYAFETLQKLEVPIPQKIALMGFDDFELAGTLRPSISVVQQPAEDLGRVAAELLFEQILNRHKTKRVSTPKRGSQIKLESRLVLRASCGCKVAS